jgi:hypothetical protein
MSRKTWRSAGLQMAVHSLHLDQDEYVSQNDPPDPESGWTSSLQQPLLENERDTASQLERFEEGGGSSQSPRNPQPTPTISYFPAAALPLGTVGSNSIRQRGTTSTTTGAPALSATALSTASFQATDNSNNAITCGRILDRDGAFYQSRGRWRVERVARDAARFYHNTTSSTATTAANERVRPRCVPLRKQFWDDWFYSLAYQRTCVLMLILFCTYTAIVVAFGFLYLFVSLAGRRETRNPDGTTQMIAFCHMVRRVKDDPVGSCEWSGMLQTVSVHKCLKPLLLSVFV